LFSRASESLLAAAHQVMIYLGTAEAFEKPTQALRKTALVMAEASKHMELGEYNFNFMDGYIPRDSDIEYDSDCLENLIE